MVNLNKRLSQEHFQYSDKFKPMSWNGIFNKSRRLFILTFAIPFLILLLWGFIELGFIDLLFYYIFSK